MVIYGGENEHREHLSDVIIFDTKTHHWSQPEITGQLPRGRARHAAVIYDDKLFIIGGLMGENYILDEICYLDLLTWTWSRTWTFVGRFDHTAHIWEDRLYVIGGLGPEMERSTNIWWLDLKGSSSISMITPSVPQTPRQASSYGQAIPINPAPQATNSGGYAANSGSVQTRTNRAQRYPTAPGSAASLQFLSGPNIPSQMSGTHYHVFNSGMLLDFMTPSATLRATECMLSILDLGSMQWEKILDGEDLFRPGYYFHYCFVNEEGSKAWLLGCPVDPASPTTGTEKLSEIMIVDLTKYGLTGGGRSGEKSFTSTVSRASNSGPVGLGSLGGDLASLFDVRPEDGSGADFVITADAEERLLDDDLTSEAGSQNQVISLASEGPKSDPIHVHRIILQARWPHFKRLYSAQMSEYHTKKMHIPEPYSVVRAFLYYLYSDSIAPHPVYCNDLRDVAGVLIMANLYDMPALRLECVNRLSREMSIDTAAIIWERANRTGEEWLKRKAANYCLANWGRIVRTEGFRSLSRQSLMELCAVTDRDSRVMSHEEIEVMEAMGGRFEIGYLGREAKRARLSDESEDESDDSQDDDMEMN